MGLFESIGSFLGINNNDEAAQAQTSAANNASDTQWRMYEQQRKDSAPWRAAGQEALGGLQNRDYQRDFTLADFQADPGYNFRMQEGMKAINRAAAARGNSGGSATLKALAEHNSGLASQEYSNAYNRFNADRDRRFNRLSSLAGLGQTANSQVAEAGMNAANNVSANQIGIGNAQAGALVGNAQFNTGLLKDAISGGAKILVCDERLKTNIAPIAKEDMEELKSVLKPYKFTYKDQERYGNGEWVGIMAQDLEKSKLGKTVVFKDHDGFLKINSQKLMSLLLATLAAEA